jgi:ABC-type multidrug transport system ATPase subunit
VPDDVAASVLELADVTYAYHHRPVLRGVTLRLRRGERVAVVGANGAGKTTLLRVAAGLVRPRSGSAVWFGRHPTHTSVRARIGFVAHDSLLYDGMTLAENLRFFAALYGVPATRVGAVAAATGLEPLLARDVRVLSRGQRQRANLARALLHEPELLVLDEPQTGLDAAARAQLLALLDDARERRAVLFATHDAADVAALADRALTIADGRVREAGA